MALVDLLALKQHEVVSIVGSGGKTTLLNALAQIYHKQKILMTTTTKISPPTQDLYQSAILTNTESTPAANGVTLWGIPNVNGKLSAPNLALLKKQLINYDKILIEADGAKRKPLKAWADFEPVVISDTTTTIGILPLNICGRKINASIVHRLDIFLALGDFYLGQVINPTVLARVISHPQGLFKGARGRKILLLNRVASPQTKAWAQQVVAALPAQCRADLSLIVGGNFKEQQEWKKYGKTSN